MQIFFFSPSDASQTVCLRQKAHLGFFSTRQIVCKSLQYIRLFHFWYSDYRRTGTWARLRTVQCLNLGNRISLSQSDTHIETHISSQEELGTSVIECPLSFQTSGKLRGMLGLSWLVLNRQGRDENGILKCSTFKCNWSFAPLVNLCCPSRAFHSSMARNALDNNSGRPAAPREMLNKFWRLVCDFVDKRSFSFLFFNH